MKTFLKTLIGGALGVGALYVVGKICYEAGKDVAKAEQQIEKQLKTETVDYYASGEHVAQIEMNLDELDPIDKKPENAKEEMSEAIDEAFEKDSKPTMLGRLVNKVKNAKLFMAAKKAFEKSNKSPGILSSLLTNPDGAKIEAYVRDGGVQISVKPRAA